MFKRRIFALSLVSVLGFWGCSESVSENGDEQQPGTCGNSIVEAGEDCDGTQFAAGKNVCPAGTMGTVTCGTDCKVVTSACVSSGAPAACNNGVLDAGEDCDGTQFAAGKDVCPAGTMGTVTCGTDCKVVTSACVPAAACNNGVLDAGEDCDGTQFAEGKKVCPEGTTGDTSKIYCNDKCEVVTTTACLAETAGPVCGDGAVNAAGEDCENSVYGVVNAGGAVITCENFEGSGAKGTLKCADCKLDSSECVAAEVAASCGNNVLDEGEVCDGKAFSDDAAVLCGVNYKAKDKSEWVCTSGCSLDINASCEPIEVVSKCGNLKLDDDEECDVVSGKVVTEETCPEGQELKGDAFICTDECTVDFKASCKAISACPENELKCDNNTLKFCVDGVWEDYVTCPTDMACDENAEDVDFCVPQQTCTGSFDTCVGNLHYACIDGGWISEDCSESGKVCGEGEGCVEPPPCGNGVQDANEKCETIDGVFVPWDYDVQAYGCNYYNEIYDQEYILYKSGSPTCTDECKISVQTCVALTDADFTPVKSWTFSSLEQIKELTKSGDVTIHNAGNSGFKSEYTNKAWEVGSWPTNLNWDAYMWFKVGTVDTNAVSITFNVKRGDNGPKKLQIQAFSNGTSQNAILDESNVISLDTDWATHTVRFKAKSTIGDFSFKVSAYNGTGSLFIQNVQVKKANAI